MSIFKLRLFFFTLKWRYAFFLREMEAGKDRKEEDWWGWEREEIGCLVRGGKG